MTGSEASWHVTPLSVDTVWHLTFITHSINTLQFTQLANNTPLHFRHRSVIKKYFFAKKIQISKKVALWKSPLRIPQITVNMWHVWRLKTCTSGSVIQTQSLEGRHALAPLMSSPSLVVIHTLLRQRLQLTQSQRNEMRFWEILPIPRQSTTIHLDLKLLHTAMDTVKAS
jgi:hypothetical protein